MQLLSITVVTPLDDAGADCDRDAIRITNAIDVNGIMPVIVVTTADSIVIIKMHKSNRQ